VGRGGGEGDTPDESLNATRTNNRKVHSRKKKGKEVSEKFFSLDERKKRGKGERKKHRLSTEELFWLLIQFLEKKGRSASGEEKESSV